MANVQFIGKLRQLHREKKADWIWVGHIANKSHYAAATDKVVYKRYCEKARKSLESIPEAVDKSIIIHKGIKRVYYKYIGGADGI